MKRTLQVVVAAIAAVPLAVSSVAADGIARTAGAQGNVRGVTSEEIKVGGLGVTASYGPASDAAKARFDQANARGEIPGGRKINYIGFTDDKSTPDVNLQEGQRLVDQERVFAVVPVITPSLQAASHFQEEKVPTLGWGISSAFCDSSITYLFGFTGCLVPNRVKYVGNAWGEMVSKQLRAEGKGSAKGKTAAVIADNNDSGKSEIQSVSATAEAVGMKVVYTEAALPPPGSITDYSPYVQKLLTSNGGQAPDVIFLVAAEGNVFGLGRALNQAGFKGIQTNVVSYAPQRAAAATGWSAFTQFATPESTAPKMAMITQTLTSAGVDPIGQPALAGYYSADMFVQILKKVGKNLTPEAFQKASAKFTYQIEDVIGPTVYPAAFRASTPCGQLAISDGTRWTVAAPFGCSQLLTQSSDGTFKEVPYPSGVKK